MKSQHEVVAKLTARSAQYEAAMRRAVGGTASLRSAWLSLGGTVAASAVGADMVRTMIGYEQALTMVKGVTGATAAEMTGMQQTARELGATTVFSAQQAGEGLLNLSRAGFTATESIQSLPSTLALAAAAQIGLDASSAIASNTLRQFSLDASQSGRVADVFVNSTNNANTTVREMAESMKMVGSISGVANISVEEMGAAIGVLGDKGIKATMAGTNLRGIILRLASPSGEAKAALERLGLSTEDVSVKANGLIGVLRKFRSSGILDSPRDLADAFGLLNSAAASALIESVDKVDQLTTSNQEAAGSADALAEAMNSTLAGAAKGLRSALEELYLQAGDAGVNGLLKDLLVTGADVLRIWGGMEDSLSDNASAAYAVTDSLQLLAAGLGTVLAYRMGAHVLAWADTANQAVPALLSMRGAALGSSAAIHGLKGAWTGLQVAMASNPVGLVLAGITALTSAYALFGDTAEDVARRNDTFSRSLENTRDIVEDLEDVARRAAVASELGDFSGMINANMRRIDLAKQLILELKEMSQKGTEEIQLARGRIGRSPVTGEDIFKVQSVRDLAKAFQELGVEVETSVRATGGIYAKEFTTIDQALSALIGRTKELMQAQKAQSALVGETGNQVDEQGDAVSRTDSLWQLLGQRITGIFGGMKQAAQDWVDPAIAATDSWFQDMQQKAVTYRQMVANARSDLQAIQFDAMDPGQQELANHAQRLAAIERARQTELVKEFDLNQLAEAEHQRHVDALATIDQQRQADVEQINEFERQSRIRMYSDMAGSLATLTEDLAQQNKAAFYAHKIFAASQATANAWLAYSNTLAQASASPQTAANPAWAQVAAGLNLAAGMKSVAEIMATEYGGGKATGGLAKGGTVYEGGEYGMETFQAGGHRYFIPPADGYVDRSSQMRGGEMHIQHHVHVPSGHQSRQTARRQADGSIRMETVVEQVERDIAGRVGQGVSPFNQSIEQRYGLHARV
jgi:TP901 family phage tail tape measure protein